MIQALINAEAECTWVDLKPDKELMPIGHIYKKWEDCLDSTDEPHWMYWEVMGVSEVFVRREGSIAYYERFNDIEFL